VGEMLQKLAILTPVMARAQLETVLGGKTQKIIFKF
jgi:hypothetical protein